MHFIRHRYEPYPSAIPVGHGFLLTPQDIVFESPIRVELSYKDYGIDPRLLDVFEFDTQSGRYQKIDGQCDYSEEICTVEVTHFKGCVFLGLLKGYLEAVP